MPGRFLQEDEFSSNFQIASEDLWTAQKPGRDRPGRKAGREEGARTGGGFRRRPEPPGLPLPPFIYLFVLTRFHAPDLQPLVLQHPPGRVKVWPPEPLGSGKGQDGDSVLLTDLKETDTGQPVSVVRMDWNPFVCLLLGTEGDIVRKAETHSREVVGPQDNEKQPGVLALVPTCNPSASGG